MENILGVGSITITDLNDALISGDAPRNPDEGALWIDSSANTPVLKVYKNGSWQPQEIDVNNLDPELSETVSTIVNTLGTLANDGLLTHTDRLQVSAEIANIIGQIPSKQNGNVYPNTLPAYNVIDSLGVGSFSSLRQTARDATVPTDNTYYIALEQAYTTLNSYLSSLTPRPWDVTATNKDKNTEVDNPDEYRESLLNYYLAEMNLATYTEKRASDAAKEYTDASVSDAITSVDVEYATSTDSKTVPEDDTWDTLAPTWSDGLFIWSRTLTTYKNGSTYITDPVNITGAKGESGGAGTPGRSITKIEEEYYHSDSATQLTGGTWSKTRPEWKDGKFIWTRSIITFANPSGTQTTDPISVTGAKGEKGDPGSNAPTIKLSGDSQMIKQDSSGNVTPSTSFNITGVAVNTTITSWLFSVNGGAFGTGLTTGVTRSGNVVTINPKTVTFNTLSIRAEDGTITDTFTIGRAVDGTKGDKGDKGSTGGKGSDGKDGADAYTVLLSNESHTFQAGTSSAVAGSTTTDIHAYKGTNKVAVTVGTITGMPTGMSRTVSNNNTKNARVTFTVATNMTSPNGTVTINLTVDNKPIVKEFSYALTFKGDKGDKGDTGEQGPRGVRGLQGPEGKQGIKGDDGANGVSSYTHIAYATGDQGQSFNHDSFPQATYIGMYVSPNQNSSDNWRDYEWTLIKGDRGDRGLRGPEGDDGKTPYFHVAWANNSTGTSGFSRTSSTGKLYIGTYTSFDSNPPAAGTYNWTLIKGDKGDKGDTGSRGAQGPQGIRGPKGSDGQSQWVHVRYSANSNGNPNQTNPSSTTKYIGIAVTNSSTAPSYTGFTWSKYIGDDGSRGPQGIQGPKGDDGLDTYTWIRYADEKDGTGINNYPDGKKFIGMAYNKTTPNESNNPSDYTWSAMYDEEAFKGIGLADKTEILSGTEIYTDKADNSVVHVDIDGKSYQHAGSGKNLFNLEKLKSLSPTSWATTARVYDFNIKENTEYTLSTNLPRGQNELYINGSSSTARDVYLGKALTIETDSSGEIFIAVASERERSNDILNGKYWIQLEEGSTATPYEPPAPTPDYPIEIHSLNDFDVVSQKSEGGVIDGIKVGGRNLLRNSGEEVSNGTYNIARYDLTDEIKEGEEVTLTIWGELASTKSSFRAYNSGGFISLVTLTDNGDGTYSRTFKWRIGSSTNTYLNVYTFTKTQTGISTINKIKLERDNTATDWTPAPEDISENDNHPLIDKINLSLSEPLRSAGGAKDRLFRDSDGLWKIERNVGEYVADGSENWRRQSGYSDGHRFDMRTSIPYSSSGKYENALNTHFVSDGIANNADGVHSTWVFNRNPRVVHFGINSADELKSWMKSEYEKGTPVTWLYELGNPTIETLDQELQDKLNNLRSFQDSNYVYTVFPDKTDILPEKLKPTLHATFKGGGWYNRFKTGSEVERLDTKITDGMEEVSSAVTAEWKTEAESIRGDVESTYVSANDFATLQTDISTSFEQTESAFDFRFEEAEKLISETEGNIETLENEIKKYIRFVDGSIILGAEGSTSEVIITNEKISFMQGGDDPVAFIEGQEMQINHGIFVDSATIAGFKFELVSGDDEVLGITWTD